jgi:hypothetical protein
LGVQFTVTPAAGIALTKQVALAAGLGPLLAQVTVPVTKSPALAKLGKPDTAACISDCGVIASGSVSTLLLGFGSAVLDPVVVVMLRAPTAGALKVDVQVIDCPTPNGLGAGVGVQVCVAPEGSPLNTHVADAAALGPAFVHTPLTVTGWPALTLAGTVVLACMSACGVTLVMALVELLPLTGSAVLLPAATVAVTLPLAGAT